MNSTLTEKFAKTLRKHIVEMTYKANSSHSGSCLSITDIIAVLYGKIMNIDPKNPDDPNRDRFILSKGHAAAVVYAALAEKEFFPITWLDKYCKDDSSLLGHITHKDVPGVEVSTGSLGHGLPIACGMSYACKQDNLSHFIYIIMGDGEINEGSNWESFLFAAHHELSQIIIFLDYNKIQSFGNTNDILNLEPLCEKITAFNWHVQEIDGHQHKEIENAILEAQKEKRPSLIIAHTVKGKGVHFMENQLLWHYRSPNENELKMALNDIEQGI